MERSKKLKAGKEPQREIVFDLAVIGCGPSGALAASLAAEAGLSTVILESKKHPRPKICGGFLSTRSIDLLPEDLSLSSLQAGTVYQVSLIKKRNFYYIDNSKKPLGLVIKREKFDQLMAEYACSKGAILREKEALKAINITGENETRAKSYYLLESEKTEGKTLKVRYLMGADGAMGNTALLAGLRKPGEGIKGWGLSQIVKTKPKVADTSTAKFYPLPFLGGMGWSFSGPDWTNHGVGGLFGRNMLLKAKRKLFHNQYDHSTPLFWPLPFLGPLQKPATGNLLLIGDAAGLVDPFSGEGLYNSFKSAILAVQAVIAAEKNGIEASNTYNYLFRKNFREKFAASLCGALLLHTRSIVKPSSLAHQIADLMENKLWFNYNIDLSSIHENN